MPEVSDSTRGKASLIRHWKQAAERDWENYGSRSGKGRKREERYEKMKKTKHTVIKSADW